MNAADNAQLRHIKLAFENASSYHFLAHNDLSVGDRRLAFSVIKFRWAPQYYVTTAAHN